MVSDLIESRIVIRVGIDWIVYYYTIRTLVDELNSNF